MGSELNANKNLNQMGFSAGHGSGTMINLNFGKNKIHLKNFIITVIEYIIYD